MSRHGTVEPYLPDRTDIANYGPNKRPRDVVADFLLGGNRKRLIIERLAGSEASSAELISELGIGRTTVFEAIRVLRGAEALDEVDGRYRLTRKTPLGRALRKLVEALATGGDERVDRPPRPSRPRRVSSRRGRRVEKS